MAKWTDDFSGGAQDPLSGNWATAATRGGTTFVGFKRLASPAEAEENSGSACSLWTANTPGGDQYSKAKITQVGTGYVGISGRAENISGGKIYLLHSIYNGGSNGSHPWKIVSNSWTYINGSAFTGPTWAVNDVIEIRCVGSTVGFYRNGTAFFGPYTDTTNTGGYVGLASYSGGATRYRVDDWEGGDILSFQYPIFKHRTIGLELGVT